MVMNSDTGCGLRVTGYELKIPATRNPKLVTCLCRLRYNLKAVITSGVVNGYTLFYIYALPKYLEKSAAT